MPTMLCLPSSNYQHLPTMLFVPGPAMPHNSTLLQALSVSGSSGYSPVTHYKQFEMGLLGLLGTSNTPQQLC